MLKNFALLIVMLFVLNGCTTMPPNELYKKIINTADKTANTNLEIINNAKAISLPKTIHGFSLNRESFRITEDDPIVDLDKFKSNYKLFSFVMGENANFEIKILSLCDCFGFDKRILSPVIDIITENGDSLKNISVDKGYNAAAISLNIKGKSTTKGKYYLLVAADNSSVGKKLAGSTRSVIVGITAAPIPFTAKYSSTINPFGKFIPSYEIIE